MFSVRLGEYTQTRVIVALRPSKRDLELSYPTVSPLLSPKGKPLTNQGLIDAKGIPIYTSVYIQLYTVLVYSTVYGSLVLLVVSICIQFLPLSSCIKDPLYSCMEQGTEKIRKGRKRKEKGEV